MELLSLDKLKTSKEFKENIRWDVTPDIFLNPCSASGGKSVDLSYGYMMYIDIVHKKPAVFVMVLKPLMSKTVGYICDIPEQLLSGAMQCAGKCVSGMYPLTKALEDWIKKELGLAA